MWGAIAKGLAWAWAHRSEIIAGWRVYQALRKRRKERQRPDENAREYYARTVKREGLAIVKKVSEGTLEAEALTEFDPVDAMREGE